jgi:GNAT superfamily N-acetyltransferase
MRARIFAAHDHGSATVKAFYQLSLTLEDDSKLEKGDERDLWSGSAHLIYINWLAVQKPFQGNGLGRYLLIDALAKSFQASQYLPILGVGIRPLTERNNATYKKNGFRISDDEMGEKHPLMILNIWTLRDLFSA